MTLVLNSTQSGLTRTRSDYTDYIFYTNFQIKSETFKIIHSIEVALLEDGDSGDYDMYLLVGDSGKEYYVGTYTQGSAAVFRVRDEAQRLIATLDNDTAGTSIFTVRIRPRTSADNNTTYKSYLANAQNHLPLGVGHTTTPYTLGTNHVAMVYGDVDAQLIPGLNVQESLKMNTGFVDVSSTFLPLLESSTWTVSLWVYGNAFNPVNQWGPMALLSIVDSDLNVGIEIGLEDDSYLLITPNETKTAPALFVDPDTDKYFLVLSRNGNELSLKIYETGFSLHEELTATYVSFTPAFATMGAALKRLEEGETPVDLVFDRGGYAWYMKRDGTDKGPFGLDATLVGWDGGTGPSRINDLDGRDALDFSTGYFDLSAYANEQFTGPTVTFSMWTRQDVAARFDYFFTVSDVINGEENDDERFWILFDENRYGINLRTGGSNIISWSIPGINRNVWTHLAVVIAPGDYRAYVDGTLQDEPLGTDPNGTETIFSVLRPTADRVFLGQRKPGFPTTNVRVSDFIMFNRALTEFEIRELYIEQSMSLKKIYHDNIGETTTHTKALDEPAISLLYHQEEALTTSTIAPWQLKLRISQV